DCALRSPEAGHVALCGRREPNTPGWLEVASQGSLFLRDAVALSPEAQQALAEMLKAFSARPVDGDDDARYPTKARVIASARKSPEELRSTGALSDELAARFTTVVRVPSLRE